jgi:hypothetical protein
MKITSLPSNSLNQDQAMRDSIIGIKNPEYFGGCEHYSGLTLEQLDKLIDNRFIDLSDRQNDSPTAQEFYEFIKDHPEVKAHGYVISKDRNDYRVSIEGLEFDGVVSKTTMSDFVKLCRHADEFTCEQNKLRSWWD